MQPIVINSRFIDICAWADGCIYDLWVYELTIIRLILPSAYPQDLCISRRDIQISSGHTQLCIFQYDYLYSATRCIENTLVLLDGPGWISYDCTMSPWQLQVKVTLNL